MDEMLNSQHWQNPYDDPYQSGIQPVTREKDSGVKRLSNERLICRGRKRKLSVTERENYR